MADEKISAMPAATSVAPTDLLTIVQGGVNKQATANLVAANAPVTFPPLASAPGSPTVGQAYYDTTQHGAFIYGDDDTWHEIVTS